MILRYTVVIYREAFGHLIWSEKSDASNTSSTKPPELHAIDNRTRLIFSLNPSLCISAGRGTDILLDNDLIFHLRMYRLHFTITINLLHFGCLEVFLSIGEF